MRRFRAQFLIDWLHSSSRKPLVIRGARQVGKTWLIRDLAQSQGLHLIEINFEKRPNLASLFTSNEPKEIMLNLSALFGGGKELAQSILFLDEIQAAPQILAVLRWFAEEMPELPVVAAGSLLDFALEKHEFSMPVGRIGYLYLEPLSFEEFLEAIGQSQLRLFLQDYTLNRTIPLAIHQQLMKFVKEYLIVGGMPAAVSSWAAAKKLDAINQLHFDLIANYRDDFTKYRGRIQTERLEDVINSVPRQLGHKFVFKEANPEVNYASLKQALDLLIKARVCHRISSTSSNGLPLGAEVDEKFSKVIFLDSGLCNAFLGLTLHQLHDVAEICTINQGAMAEQLVGSLLRTIFPPYVPPALYYWQRGKKNAEAEIDYVFQHESRVIPIEVKAGTTGTLKSLHQFMKEKKSSIAVRFNSDVPHLGLVKVQDATSASIEYTLLSLPFYLAEQLHRLIPT